MRALSGISVHIRSDNHSEDTVTDDDGVYEFYDMPAGQYRIAIDVPKGLRIDFPMIGGGQGRRDHLEPAAGEASRYFYIGCSQADGGYRLEEMPPGQYLITAEAWESGRLSAGTGSIFA